MSGMVQDIVEDADRHRNPQQRQSASFSLQVRMPSSIRLLLCVTLAVFTMCLPNLFVTAATSNVYLEELGERLHL